MNIFNRVTLQSLKRNRTRTTVTVIGIILSAAMICAVTTFTSSMRNYAMQTAIYSSGSWHGRELGVPYESCSDITVGGGIKAVEYVQQLGYAVAEGCKNEYKPYIYLLGADEDVDSMLPIHITEGEYPKNGSEILLPVHLYASGGIRYSIGDSITLELGTRLSDGWAMTQENRCYSTDGNGNETLNDETIDVRETRTFTVTGFYERPGNEIEPYDAPGFTAFTVTDEENAQGLLYDVYFKMKNPEKVYSFMSENEITGDCNTDVLLYLGVSKYDSFQRILYRLAAMVTIMIIFGSISLIYNAFSISVSERTKQFGLLASIGATKKQLRRMVLFEAMAVSAIGIPLGIAAGIGGIGITFLLIGDKFMSLGSPVELTLCVSPLSLGVAVVVAIVTVLISAWIPSIRATRVSAVEAIRQNNDISVKKHFKTSKLAYGLFGLPGMLASKYYRRSKKKYRATILSLFMSIVLFVSTSTFTDYLMESVTGGFGTADYDVSFDEDEKYFCKISQNELLDRVKTADSVTAAAYARGGYVNTEVDFRYLTEKVLESLDSWSYQWSYWGEDNDTNKAYINTYLQFINDSEFKKLLAKYDLDESEYMNSGNPLAIALDGEISFNRTKEKYETVKYLNSDSCEFAAYRSRTIDGYVEYGETVDENGNAVYRYVKDDGKSYADSEYLDVPIAEAYVSTTFKVGKVIYEKMFYNGFRDGVVLIYPVSLEKAVMGELAEAYNWSYTYYICSDKPGESFNSVKSILRENGFDVNGLYNYAEQVENSRNLVTIIQVFSYGFVVLISLIAAANVFNTISTNISLRRREFAMLKSVGMDSKGFNKMMNYECMLYGSKALLYGLPVSLLFSYLIWLTIREGFTMGFTLPWEAIGIATFGVFAVVFITMVYAMSKVKKENPIDALKNENL